MYIITKPVLSIEIETYINISRPIEVNKEKYIEIPQLRLESQKHVSSRAASPVDSRSRVRAPTIFSECLFARQHKGRLFFRRYRAGRVRVNESADRPASRPEFSGEHCLRVSALSVASQAPPAMAPSSRRE